MDSAKLEALMQREVEAFNHHDVEAFTSLYAEDATAYDPQYAEPLPNREAIRKDIQDFFAAFPDARANVLSSVANGNTIAFEVEVSGTHLGPLVTPGGDVPATSRPVLMRGSRVMRFNDEGRLTSCNRYYDLAGVLQQLGLMG